MSAVVSVHFLPSLIAPGALAGAQAVVIDLLRASTTICAAVHAGAACIRPVLEPEEAHTLRAMLAPRECILGGERKGVLIPGFDLGNSPRSYTPERVGGRDVIFTTTNGTRAIHAASREGASRVLIGCFANLAAIVDAVCSEGRAVHIVCAGTNGEVSMEDVLCAGAIVSRLCEAGFVHGPDDQCRIAQRLYEAAAAEREGVLRAMRESRGGRNLVHIGLDQDIHDCLRVDWLPLVPQYDAGSGTITPAV
jgi:2-phosphosulfolactate phosphatase